MRYHTLGLQLRQKIYSFIHPHAKFPSKPDGVLRMQWNTKRNLLASLLSTAYTFNMLKAVKKTNVKIY